mgnify:CR=1 FL=1
MKPKIGGGTWCKQNIESELQNLKSAGYDFAEIDLGLPIEPNSNFENEIEKAKNIMPIISAHLPEIDFKTEEIERCKKFIEILSKQNINLFVVHLFSKNLSTSGNIDLKINGLKELADFAKNNNSVLALENTEEDVDILKQVFDKIPEIYFCLDIGHANLFAPENRSINLIENFGKVLKHIHLHDNIGGDAEKFDLHLPLGAGRIDFVPIFDKLKEINYSGNIVLEIYKPDEEYRKISIDRTKKLI